MQPYAPLGTLYAASALRARGHDVALFDAMLATGVSEWDDALAQHQPTFAVLFEDNFNYLSKMCLLRMRDAAFHMLRMARVHGCIAIACGADVTDHAGLYLAAGAHFVILGEGEGSLAELIESLGAALPTSDLTQIPPIAGVMSTRTVVPVRRPDIRDLDAMPFPAWDLVDVNRYRQIWLKHHGFFSMNMVTTRGCPYHCNWCAKPIWGQRYNVRSPQNVEAELAHLRARYAPDHINFVDDIFGLKPGWVEQFATLMVAGARPVVPFKCLMRADLVQPEIALALVRAGCKTVWIGAESGSQKVLDAMDKGDTVQDIRAASQTLRQHGIAVGFFLQFGYPGETWQDIRLTRQMIQDCAPDDIGISVSYPLPGTKFHDRVRADLGLQHNWTDSADLAMLYAGPYSARFYRRLHRVVHAGFRLQQLIRKPNIKRLARAPVEAVHYYAGALDLAGQRLLWKKSPRAGVV